jgi:hypothetical protein
MLGCHTFLKNYLYKRLTGPNTGAGPFGMLYVRPLFGVCTRPFVTAMSLPLDKVTRRKQQTGQPKSNVALLPLLDNLQQRHLNHYLESDPLGRCWPHKFDSIWLTAQCENDQQSAQHVDT